MTTPFDDPSISSAFRRAGVVHQPGMANDLMKEVAPLLAAEGIDLNNPDTFDMATLNDAFGRAVERLNFERFVAVGEPRAYALTVLRLASEALDEGSITLFDVVIRGLDPEPKDRTTASIAQIIGVSLGLLDEWYADARVKAHVDGARLPVVIRRSRAAGTEVLALARKGRAFDSIDSLHRRQSGLAILEGGMLAVTAVLQRWAAAEGVTVRELGMTALAE